MSKLVQVDVSDWDNINPKEAEKAFDRIWDEVMEPGDVIKLYAFFQQVELIRDKQIKASTKQIPALFKPKEQ
jgi:hypothetical protein